MTESDERKMHTLQVKGSLKMIREMSIYGGWNYLKNADKAGFILKCMCDGVNLGVRYDRQKLEREGVLDAIMEVVEVIMPVIRKMLKKKDVTHVALHYSNRGAIRVTGHTLKEGEKGRHTIRTQYVNVHGWDRYHFSYTFSDEKDENGDYTYCDIDEVWDTLRDLQARLEDDQRERDLAALKNQLGHWEKKKEERKERFDLVLTDEYWDSQRTAVTDSSKTHYEEAVTKTEEARKKLEEYENE